MGLFNLNNEKSIRATKFARWKTGLRADYMGRFQPGLKLKSELNPGRNFSVAFVVLAIYILRVPIVFSIRSDIFSCDFT